MVQTETPKQPASISQEEAARRIGVSTRTVRRWIQRGEIPTIQFNRTKRVRADLLEAWLDERTDWGKAPGEE